MKKKVCKAKLIRRLKKKGDKYWSLYIRMRDGLKCAICGSTKSLQSHHAVIRKALSLRTRWDIFNGICLCYRCHLIELHRYASKQVIDIYLEKLNALYTKEQMDAVVTRSKDSNIKVDLLWLENVVKDLQERIALLKSGPKS